MTMDTDRSQRIVDRARPIEIAKRALISGGIASLVSTLAVSVCSRYQTGSAATATNTTSHWIGGDAHAQGEALTARNTAVGYAIHHLMSLLWAGVYESFPERRPLSRAAMAACVSCLVDYTVTPERLRPGIEARVSRGAIAAFYIAFGAGLFLATAGRRRRRPQRRGSSGTAGNGDCSEP